MEQELVHSLIAPPLNKAEISKAFSLFADKQKVSIVSLIKILIPELQDKVISVTMTRQQEEFIGEVKIEWQAFLRQYFKDNEITIQFVIDDKANTQRRAYTASEQFEEMLNSNELFKKMVNQFKLKLKQ